MQMFSHLKDKCLGFDDKGYYKILIDYDSETVVKAFAKVLKDNGCDVKVEKNESGGWLVRFKKKKKPKARNVQNRMLNELNHAYETLKVEMYATLNNDEEIIRDLQLQTQLANNIKDTKRLIQQYQKATVRRSY